MKKSPAIEGGARSPLLRALNLGQTLYSTVIEHEFRVRATPSSGNWCPKHFSTDRPLFSLASLEPIREVWIQDEGFAATRLSMMRIMARRTKAATVVA